MSIEKDILNKLTNLLQQIDSIQDPIICDEAIELRNLATELSRKIYNKFQTSQQSFVDINYF